jgi:hypothetical protein
MYWKEFHDTWYGTEDGTEDHYDHCELVLASASTACTCISINRLVVSQNIEAQLIFSTSPLTKSFEYRPISIHMILEQEQHR